MNGVDFLEPSWEAKYSFSPAVIRSPASTRQRDTPAQTKGPALSSGAFPDGRRERGGQGSRLVYQRNYQPRVSSKQKDGAQGATPSKLGMKGPVHKQKPFKGTGVIGGTVPVASTTRPSVRP